jgi:RNA polymerase sigma-70 factor (ECF subfamily)
MLSESSGYAQLSDRELVEKIKESDEQAFQEFKSRHWRLVYGICRRILLIPQEAEDIALDAFLKFWTKRDKCDANNNPKSWICKIAKNQCIDLLRKRKGEVIASDTAYLDNREDPAAGPEEIAIGKGLWDARLPCFKDLNEQELRVLIMIYLAESNSHRVSKALGLKYNEILKIHQSAIAKLRNCMEVSHHD